MLDTEDLASFRFHCYQETSRKRLLLLESESGLQSLNPSFPEAVHTLYCWHACCTQSVSSTSEDIDELVYSDMVVPGL